MEHPKSHLWKPIEPLLLFRHDMTFYELRFFMQLKKQIEIKRKPRASPIFILPIYLSINMESYLPRRRYIYTQLKMQTFHPSLLILNYL